MEQNHENLGFENRLDLNELKSHCWSERYG